MVALASVLGCAARPPAKDPHRHGQRAIHDLSDAYSRLLRIALPAAAAPALANLRRSLDELERLLGQASAAPGSWRPPSPAEQADWRRARPDGGVLLRRYACAVARGDDLEPGGLWVSDAGVAVEEGGSPTGGVFGSWGFHAELRRCRAEVSGAGGFRVLLAMPEDAAWIEELWSLQQDSAKAENADLAAPPVPGPPAAPRDKVPAPDPGPPRGRGEAPPVLLGRVARPPEMARCPSWGSECGEPYTEGPGGRKAFHPPEPACVPLGSDRLAGAEVSRIVAELSSDEYLSAFFRGAKQAADLSMTPWRASKQSPGVLVRKATFLFPIPQDFPKAVTRLVSIPEATKVTAVSRLHEQDGVAIFTVQFCSHDIPFGEHFRVHETLKFQADGRGDVRATRWTEVMWITSLPWAFGILKPIIEQRSRADALGNYLVADLRAKLE